MVNRVEGRRGFGTPAEALFEVSHGFIGFYWFLLVFFSSLSLGCPFGLIAGTS